MAKKKKGSRPTTLQLLQERDRCIGARSNIPFYRGERRHPGSIGASDAFNAIIDPQSTEGNSPIGDIFSFHERLKQSIVVRRRDLATSYEDPIWLLDNTDNTKAFYLRYYDKDLSKREVEFVAFRHLTLRMLQDYAISKLFFEDWAEFFFDQHKRWIDKTPEEMAKKLATDVLNMSAFTKLTTARVLRDMRPIIDRYSSFNPTTTSYWISTDVRPSYLAQIRRQDPILYQAIVLDRAPKVWEQKKDIAQLGLLVSRDLNIAKDTPRPALERRFQEHLGRNIDNDVYAALGFCRIIEKFQNISPIQQSEGDREKATLYNYWAVIDCVDDVADEDLHEAYGIFTQMKQTINGLARTKWDIHLKQTLREQLASIWRSVRDKLIQHLENCKFDEVLERKLCDCIVEVTSQQESHAVGGRIGAPALPRDEPSAVTSQPEDEAVQAVVESLFESMGIGTAVDDDSDRKNQEAFLNSFKQRLETIPGIDPRVLEGVRRRIERTRSLAPARPAPQPVTSNEEPGGMLVSQIPRTRSKPRARSTSPEAQSEEIQAPALAEEAPAILVHQTPRTRSKSRARPTVPEAQPEEVQAPVPAEAPKEEEAQTEDPRAPVPAEPPGEETVLVPEQAPEEPEPTRKRPSDEDKETDPGAKRRKTRPVKARPPPPLKPKQKIKTRGVARTTPAPEPEPEPDSPDLTYVFHDKRHYELIRVLFPLKKEKEKPKQKLNSNNFKILMSSPPLNIEVIEPRNGTISLKRTGDKVPFNKRGAGFHLPHGSAWEDGLIYEMGRRLRQSFGWEADMFKMAGEED